MKDTITLSPEEIAFVRGCASRVERSLKERFDRVYEAWKASWNLPLILVSSSPAARAQPPEFSALIALGADIVPLLIEKLIQPDEFFALVAVEELLRPDLRVTIEPTGEQVLLGEQGRAIETIQRWIRAQRSTNPRSVREPAAWDGSTMP